MDDKILDLMNKKDTSRKKYRNWKKIVTSLAAVVVFCTTYMLIVPAITMEKDTICGKEEHLHDENCYVREITQQELQLDCTYESLDVHIHSGECEDEEGNIICGLADYIVHEHKDMCFDAEQKLVCELPEVKAHTHTDECYQASEEEVSAEPVLVCNKADVAIHEHTNSCMKSTEVTVEAAEQLVCTKEEHTHDETCLPKETEDSVVENSDAASSEDDPADIGYVNAWAETEDQTAAPMMRSFAMRNSNSVSTYTTTSSDPLDMTEWINNVIMYKHENGKATEIPNGAVVYEGDLIEFKLEYTIDGQQLGKMENGVPIETLHDTVIYQIPKTFKTINSDSGDIYNSDDEIVGTYVIDSTTNQIIMKFDDTYVEDNAKGKQINGYISFYSIVDKVKQDTGTQQNHQFNSQIVVDLNVKESDEVKGDLSVKKAKTSVEGNVIKYMLSVSSEEGTHGPVVLTDVMSSGLSYVKDTITVTKKGLPVDYDFNESNGSLNLILPEMNAGETYFITYSAKADINLLDSDMEVSNTVTVESKDNKDHPVKDTTTVKHNFDVLEKTGTPGEAGEIHWEITLNKEKFDISGWTLKDILNGKEFKGPVTIYNSVNQVVAHNVTLPYKFPNGSTDTYYIRYTTDHTFAEGKEVTNKATLEKNGVTVGNQLGSGVVVGAGSPAKKLGQITGDVYVDEEDGLSYVPITWTVTIDTSIGAIPSGEFFVDKLTPNEGGPQHGFMTGEQVLNAYYALEYALQQEVGEGGVLNKGDSSATVYGSNESYKLADIEGNVGGCRNLKYEGFKFTLAKDIPQGKEVTFTYQSIGKFFENNVINSTFVNSFNISNSYEVTARVNFSVAKIIANKTAVNYYDPNGENPDAWDWDRTFSDYAEFNYEDLKENYLAWAIEVDVPPKYAGTGDVTIIEDLPEGVTPKGIRILEYSGARKNFHGLELGKTYELEVEPYGKYTIKVTEKGDLEIIIPESLIKYHSKYAEEHKQFEFWTFFHIYTQINDTHNWPYIDKDSLMSKKEFENNFTIVNSDNDTITFGKQTQCIFRDDSKGHVIKSATSEKDVVTYEVILNPEGRDFDPESSTLDVSDVLEYTSTEEHPLKLGLVSKSVKLYECVGKDSAGKVVRGDELVDFEYTYKEKFELDDDGVTTIRTHTIDLVIPDGKPLVLEYKYRADNSSSNEKHSLANSCTIESIGKGAINDDSQYEMNVQHSAAGADTNGLTLHKVDLNNYGIYIPGAKFELFIWNKEKNAFINVTDSNGNSTFETNANGKIVFDIKTDEDVGIIAKNTAYKLVETASQVLEKKLFINVNH